jgi:hypothetical protein
VPVGRSTVGRRPALDRRGTPSTSPPVAGGRAATLPEDLPILRFRLAAILAAQLFDFATFTIMVDRRGIGSELNPLVAEGFESGGFPGLLFAKLALIVLVGSIIVILGRRASPWAGPSLLATIVTLVAVGAGLVGGLSNAITI